MVEALEKLTAEAPGMKEVLRLRESALAALPIEVLARNAEALYADETGRSATTSKPGRENA